MHSQYYEAIIQVRPRKTEVERFIQGSLDNTGKALLVKKTVLKVGTDYYISSWKFAMSLGNDLVKRFGGKLNLSKKIFGRSRKKGSIVYRATISYRVSPFTKGDIIAQGDKISVVTSVGKKVVGKNILSGKKELIDQKNEWEKPNIQKTNVSRIYPQLEVISPEDYQSVVVHNQKKKCINEKVRVVLYNGRVYLID